MTHGQLVNLECHPDGDGWRCMVSVGGDAGPTRHEVRVSREILERLRPGDVEPDALVRDSFAFLLAREPRESILPSFELQVIGRYFPEWGAHVRR